MCASKSKWAIVVAMPSQATRAAGRRLRGRGSDSVVMQRTAVGLLGEGVPLACEALLAFLAVLLACQQARLGESLVVSQGQRADGSRSGSGSSSLWKCGSGVWCLVSGSGV
jgi:hypothetical protein